jgi:hypothetical protein
VRSGIWFAAGAAAGMYGVVKARRIAEAFTVDGMRDRVGAAFVGARMFRDEVAQGKADAEVQFRGRYRAAADGRHELAAPTGSTAPAIETTSTTEEGTP